MSDLLERYTQFQASVAGKDFMTKIAQNAIRFFSGGSVNPVGQILTTEQAKFMDALWRAILTGRKVCFWNLRWLAELHTVRQQLKVGSGASILLAIGRFSFGCRWFFENCHVFGNLGVINMKNSVYPNRWNQYAKWFWFFGIWFTIASNFAKLKPGEKIEKKLVIAGIGDSLTATNIMELPQRLTGGTGGWSTKGGQRYPEWLVAIGGLTAACIQSYQNWPAAKKKEEKKS